MSDLYLEEVIEETGITERNIKYWSQKFELPIEKDGRRNLYPESTVNLLRLIDLLSDTELFTHHFVELQIQRALGRIEPDLDARSDYERARREGQRLLGQIDSTLGTELLPPLESSAGRRRESPRRRKPVQSGTDLDEGIL